MTQPESVDAGKLHVGVEADTGGFAAELRRKVNEAAAKVKARIEVVLADTGLAAQLRAKVDAAAAAAQARVRVLAEVSVTQLRRAVREAAAQARAHIQAEIEVSPQALRRSVADAARQVRPPKIPVDGDTSPVRRAVAGLRRRLQIEGIDVPIRVTVRSLARLVTGSLGALNSLIFKSISGVGTLAGLLAKGAGLSILAASAAAAAVKVGAFVGNLFPAVGALALLPGLIGAAVGAFAALKIGFSGVGDALSQTISAYGKLASGAKLSAAEQEQLAAALNKLAPNARAFVVEISKLLPAFRELKLDVQQRLFESLGTAVSGLATRYLPQLRDGLGFVAEQVNLGLRASIESLNTEANQLNLADVFEASGFAAGGLAGALGNIISGFLSIAAAGLPVIREMSIGMDGLAAKFARWAQAAKESGQLEAWMRAGLAVLAQLGNLLVNLGSLIGGVFRAAATAGGDMLGLFGQVIEQLAMLVNSAEGQQILVEVFTELLRVGRAIGPVLSAAFALLGPIARIIGDLAVSAGPGFVALFDGLKAGLEALAPAAGPVGAALTQLGVLAGQLLSQLGGRLGPLLLAVANAATPLLSIIGDFVLGALPGLTSLIDFLGEGLRNLQPAAEPVGRAIGALLKAIGPLLPLLGAQLANALTLVAGLLEQIALEAGPVLDVVATLATEFSKALLPVLLELIKGALIPATQAGLAVAEAFKPLIPLFVQIGQQITSQLLTVLPQLQPIIAGALLPALSQMATLLGTALVDALTALAPYIPQLLDAMLQLYRAFIEVEVALIPLLPSLIQLGLVGVQVFIALLPLLPVFTDLIVLIADLVAGTAPFIVAAVEVASKIISWMVAGDSLKNGIGFLSGAVKAIAWVLESFIGWVRIGITVVSSLASIIGGGLAAAGRAATAVISSVIDSVRDFRDSLVDAGVQMMAGMVNGIKSKARDLVNAAKGVVRDAINAAKSLLGISSPSKVFARIGADVVAGFTVGVNDNADDATDATRKFTGDATDGAAPPRPPVFPPQRLIPRPPPAQPPPDDGVHQLRGEPETQTAPTINLYGAHLTAREQLDLLGGEMAWQLRSRVR